MDKFDLKSTPEYLTNALRTLSRYKVAVFVVFILGIYGFVVMRINTLNTAQPTDSAIAAQNNPIKAARIDKSVVTRLESLRDNNVNVQTLFEQARDNPFQE